MKIPKENWLQYQIDAIKKKLNNSELNQMTADKVLFEDGETLAEKFENGDVNTSAEQVFFDDGESLAEKYINGELGGGGSSSDDEIILTYITNSSINIANGGIATIQYGFARDIYTSRTGAEKVYVDGVLRSTRSISQGTNEVNIPNLTKGTHSITIEVSSSGLNATLVYSVEVIELSISSTFDGFSIYGSDITYRYTPVGNVEKTIYFILDGEEYATTIITESGKTMTYDFVGLSHGSHSLKVYMTAEIGGSLIPSNELVYDLVVNNGGTETIIGCLFDKTQVTQGDLVTFEYLVCNPSSLTSDVTLKINGNVVSSLTVDRSKQTWALRDYPLGDVTFTISSGDTSVSFVVKVNVLEIDVQPITHNLELYLTANGRNNTEATDVRNKWMNNGYSAVLSNFNWASNGWVKDSNQDSVLRINGDATVTIPIKLFAKDFRSTGKTIEFEFSTHDIRNYDSVLINCMSNNRGFELTSNIVRLKSEQSSVQTKFKEDEKVRISFVIEPTSENRLIYTYINGIESGLVEYPSDDDFSQSTPVGITIGSPNATIDIYNIRVYNIDLDHSDILTNYIADTPDIDIKLDLYSANDIFDSYGNIHYDKVLERIPCLTIIGDLPASKGDKKNVVIRYVNLEDTSKNFTANSAVLDIQGTSSQYYPRKNYKFKLVNSYKLTNESIAENVFCLKADYMESSHSHNTGLAKIVNKLYPVTPAKELNDKVQAAITGFPIVVWHKVSEISEPECLGVYNFNNDKDDTTTFGYTDIFPNCESWEFKNNTSAHCLFQYSNFEDTVEVAKNFEARYPDKYTDYTALGRVVSWVASTQGDLAKFKNEFESYFDMESTLLYYCLTELFAMVDSRAKNLFLTTWDGQIWYPTFYDMDTAFGLNNEGVNDFEYSVEYHDVQGTQNVFNGESSVLWNNFEQAYADEIAEYYTELRNNDKVTYDSVMSVLYGEQISKISENNYNYDAIEKYKNPLVEDNIGTYLYVAQGSRLEHLKRWLSNRINYMDSKYVVSDFKEDYITLRIYTPTNYGSVVPNADIHITPYTDQYVVVKYDENMFSERGIHNLETIIDAPNQVFNDTPLIVYGAKGISSIGDLSPLYAGTVDVSKGIKLKQLIVGNAASDYSNTNLKVLSIGNNELLNKLDVRNCPNLTQTIDASGCTNIEEIYATGTSTTAVKVPNGGNLKILHLPDTITNLTILNQPFISDFTCNNFSKINTLRLENTSLDTLVIVQEAINSLERVRLTNIDWILEDSTLLEKLMTCKGLNESGANTDKSVLTGKIHIKGAVSSRLIDECNTYYGDSLVVTADTIKASYICEFYDYDGTLLETVVVEEGDYATYNGVTPTRPADVQYKNYVFNGWNPSLETTQIIANTQFTPQFTAGALQTYNVYWYCGDELLGSQVVEYGSTAEYIGDTPVSPDGYTFVGWSATPNSSAANANFTITGETYFYAAFDKPDVLEIYVSNGSSSSSIKNLGYTLASCTGTDEEITIDWGDGNSITYTITPSGTVCTNPNVYAAGNYTIKMPGTENYKITGHSKPGLVSYTSASFNYFRIGCTGFFNYQSKLTSVSLGLVSSKIGITQLSGSMFSFCSGLNSVVIPEGVTKCSDSSTFSMCSSLKNVTLPSTFVEIGYAMFNGCSALTNVTIPSSVTRIDNAAFKDCTSLTNITIPSGVTNIYGGAVFQNCASLTSISVDENNSQYDSRNNCNAIIETSTNKLIAGCTNTIIPNGVTSINNYAFSGRTSLTNIEIPSSVTNIGDYALTIGSTTNKATIIFKSETPPTISTATFNANYLQEIKVPTFEAWQLYTTATNWSTFADYITTDDNGLLGISNQVLALDGKPTTNITLVYFGDNPTFTAVPNDTNICSASVSGDVVTITAVGSGTTNITVTMSISEETFTQTFSVEVLETMPEYPYAVEAIDGVTYGFTLNDSGYYESTNQGVGNSFSLCKLTFTSNGLQNLYLDCINSGESNYDYGILSKVDKTLTSSYSSSDSSNTFKSFRGLSNTNVQTVDYGIIEAGEHFIYIKFRKDGGGDSGNDSLQFKVRIE